jgi:hypothetical protein
MHKQSRFIFREAGLGKILTGMMLLAIVCTALPTYATVVQYQLLPLGGNDYRYVYTVTNDGSLGAGTAIELFDILFDPQRYDESTLQITTPAPLTNDWDQIFLASAPGVPAAYDAYALAGGITDGGLMSGFAVDFTWIGSGLPGSQPFVIYDPNSFDQLEAGTTVSSVPVPTAWWLLLSGVLALGTVARPVTGRRVPDRQARC